MRNRVLSKRNASSGFWFFKINVKSNMMQLHLEKPTGPRQKRCLNGCFRNAAEAWLLSQSSQFHQFYYLTKKKKERNSLAHKPPGNSTGMFLKRTFHYHLCTAPPRLQHPPRGEWLPCTSNHESLIPEIATVRGLQKPHKYQFPRASSLQLHSCTRHGLITALSCFLALISVEGNWRWAPPETDG